jgi:hypothetical protein
MDNKQAHERVPAPAPPRRQSAGSTRKHVAAGLAPMMWPGMPWMTPWLDLWTSLWAGWLGQGPLAAPHLRQHRQGEGTRRQEDSLSWLPRVETSVIPLRRHTDPPGQQAEKISVRMQVPWMGGGNVIAIDTVVPRAQSNGAAGAKIPTAGREKG